MPEPYIFLIRSGASLPEAFSEAKAEAEIREPDYTPGKIPPWLRLREQVENAVAVFCLKGPEIGESAFSVNWVSWQLGVAAAMEKPVWVFESVRSPTFLPLPYLTDYVPFDPEDKRHAEFQRTLVANYIQGKEPTGTGLAEMCPHCSSLYAIHTAVLDWNCPSCQKRTYWKGADTPAVVPYLPPSYLLQVQDDFRQIAREYPQTATG
ncbi:MAG: hypothetical protein IBX68_11315 [Dehalococcoidia bacterium]|nr:hypothetical protein [Dehalococcoidia bacterium]